MSKITRLLGHMQCGEKGTIVSVGSGPMREDKPEKEGLTERLLEMGLVEGSRVEVLHEAPISGDPIAVSVRGALVGLRRDEADYVEVLEDSE
ncbi:MAG: ferrous iron transport protein A [Bdellovibrionaceae bacterium]|nr:ferrous iron transport protein A [Bdellovibrionales bacterium]MCB9253919.1 ferrous iron transport protein A [Pseudobdellovibrionaceae bacterium]